MTDAITAQLTAPGAPFEFQTVEVAGVSCRVFKQTPACLSTLFENLEAFADMTMVVYEGRRLSYADVTTQAATLAAHLAKEHNIGRGSHVAIAMRNSPEWIVSFIAVTSLGAVAVLINSHSKADEITYCLTSTDCTLALCDQRCASGLDDGPAASIEKLTTEVPEGDQLGSGSLDRILQQASDSALTTTPCDPDDTALILFTSGTTGRPKGAQLTHRGVMTALKTNQYASAIIGAKMAARLGIDLATLAANRPQSSTLLMFPLFHVSGCHSVLLAGLTQGGKVVLMRRWDAERALQLIESEKVTMFPGVPTMHWDVLQVENRDKYDLTSMTSMSIAGQATPIPLLEAIQSAFPNAVVGSGYGLTETNGAVAFAIGDDFLSAPTSAGRVLDTAEVRLRRDDGSWADAGETGEICIRSATVMSGYFNQPNANTESFHEGWFRTGDVGMLDEDKRIYIVDRQTDMVISAGENIYCAEVERVLGEIPAILEAATFGVPDDRLGEKLVAQVRLRDDETLSSDEIGTFLGKQLAAYKVPKVIRMTDRPLPRNAAGKVLKGEIREAFLASQSN